MASLRAVIIAGAVAIGAFSSINAVKAADLDLPPPPQVELPPPPPVSGWYLRGDVGAAIDTASIYSTFAPGFYVDNPAFVQKNFTPTAILGGGAGYQINNWFRVDVTGEYQFPSTYTAIQAYGPTFCTNNTGRCNDGYKGSISSIVGLANGYFDLGTWYGVTPYVGAGIGGADVFVHGLTDTDLGGSGAFGSATDHSSFHLAWALMTGVSYSITPNLKLDFGYRYLNMGTATSNSIVCNATPCSLEVQHYRLSSQDIRIGLRYVFAEVPPIAPPLVTKY
jgi:opacity protein-like surface antigen